MYSQTVYLFIGVISFQIRGWRALLYLCLLSFVYICHFCANFVYFVILLLDALRVLLKLLQGLHPHLPVDARTLQKTPNTCNINIDPIGKGQYCHFGVASSIQNT